MLVRVESFLRETRLDLEGPHTSNVVEFHLQDIGLTDFLFVDRYEFEDEV